MPEQQTAVYEVRDGIFPVKFTGRKLAAVSTETPRTDRWVELELYKVEPGSPGLPDGGYYVHVIGQSVIFHRSGSVCNTGIRTAWADITPELAEDIRPCPDCRPEPGDEVIDLESPRHTLHRCRTALETVRQIQGPRLSAPAERLLMNALPEDEDIKAAIEGTA